MAKKNYQKTTLERQQHNMAVKVRKMTDAQLCVFIDDIQATAAEDRVKEYLQSIMLYSANQRNGIGDKTIAKLRQIAEDEGFINDSARGN